MKRNPLLVFRLLVVSFVMLIGAGVYFGYFHNVDRTIYFYEDMSVEYESEAYSICKIERIGKTEITADMYDLKTNSITLGNWTVSASNIDTKKLGKQEVIYTTSDIENNVYKRTIEVVDTVAPTIEIKKERIEMLMSEYEKFVWQDNVTCEDNYSISEHIRLRSSTDFRSINKEGEYNIDFTAVDENDNESSGSFKIVLKPDPVPEPEPVVTKPSSGGASGTASNNSGSGTTNNSKPASTTPKTTASNKVFYTRDYNYDLTAVYNAAVSYARGELNAQNCKGYEISGYTEDGTVVGYKVVFW